jgi:prepilin signal peptidase PulO-like enzyme (type II secretory pathway)
MGALDDWIAGLGGGGSLAVVLLVAVLLGLRHATDPDHLTAVSTLIVSDAGDGPARARALGFAWGAGHATSLFAFGLPIVLFGAYLPDAVQRAAEAAVGVVIVVLALRLLVRWRRGHFHTHAHRHGARWHAHPHVHGDATHPHPGAHVHAHPEALGRTPAAAYGIGLVHGMGGSAGVGLLLLGGIQGEVRSAAALLFAAATAVSMAVVSTAFGLALARGPAAGRLAALAPVLGVCGLAFGIWYGLGAVGAG